MSAASIIAAHGGDYAQYLEGKTVAPERGDYYLTPDGELTQASGRWLAAPETLERLGIPTAGPAQGDHFVALMEGRDPLTGGWLRPEGAGGGRGGGIDATFSAPKSVSVVWALADSWQREQIEQAHANAVERAVEYMRETVPVVRRRYDGQVIEETARDLIAVEYRHTTARGVSGADAPDPQLHSHVVITSVVREDERIVAVGSRPVFRSAGEVGAFYRAALADELAEQGYPIEQATGKDGKYFEIAGVPEKLREAFSGRSREVARAAERFRARHGRPPERGELRDLALENRRSKKLTTRSDLERAWRSTASSHGFGPGETLQLLAGREHEPQRMALEDRIEQCLTERRAVFEVRDLRRVALEQAAGEVVPEQALEVARNMVRDRRILTLEGGRMTTLAVRAQEEAIERRTITLARPADRDVGETIRVNASRQVAERIGAPLSREQEAALLVLTGQERAAVLIGPAGTGKGIVIDAAARAEQLAGRETIGIAVSGSTAERLGTDSPALQGSTLTLDALVSRAERGSLHIGPDTTVVLDEAGMVDHHRLDKLTAVVEQSGAKLIAVSGSTAERLGTDSPALQGSTLTLDALVSRAERGSLHIGPDTTVVLDEAGMVDHHRLDKLTAVVEQSGAKLIAVGDGQQLPAIGPGGMFDRLTEHAPTMELATIHRTKDPAEQRAWQALRSGEPERAMAHYHRQGRLHLADTRDQAAEHAVQDWARLTLQHDPREVALIADASNKEIDRLNARAQHLRAIRGELGERHVPLDSTHYDLREGDHVAFIAQHHPRGHARVENGSRGEITQICQDRSLTVNLDGSGRTIRLAAEQVESLRLAYAQHVYRQQGATVERSIVLTGGWQTSKETAYVQATRARHGTDWYIARDQLGEEGQDADRITRLARAMANSRAFAPSTVSSELSHPGSRSIGNLFQLDYLLPHAAWLRRALERDGQDHDAGIER